MQFDCAIVGGGLVGLATAYQMLSRFPQVRVIVLEKEPGVARHQSSRNSGVIHTGVYYKPGSFKAQLCVAGRAELIRFAAEHSVPHELCGKIIVATSEAERERLHNLYQRARDNGVDVQRLSIEELREREPHVTGVDAMFVAGAGVIDFSALAEALVREIRARGGEIRLGARVARAERGADGWRIGGDFGEIRAGFVVNCGGLHCDEVARVFGDVPPLRVIPFRGEYYELREEARYLCRSLIYPVPDPRFPFLGVHFTRRIDGSVECGPNAVLAFAREGYSWSAVDAKDLAGMFTYSGFRKLIVKHWRMGLSEMYRSLSKGAFVRALQKLVPEVRSEHLAPGGSGVRAQSVRPDGGLEEDFCFHRSELALHVLNAPSPAATSCFAIGRVISDRVSEVVSVREQVSGAVLS